jgi:DNA-binding NarL/FixJ family response regulator
VEAIRIFVCEAQPVVVEGLVRVLEPEPDLEFAGAAATPVEALEPIASLHPDVVLVSQEPGARPDGWFVRELGQISPESRAILWVRELESEESCLRLGFRGVIRKTCPVATLLECLRAVGQDNYWSEEGGTQPASSLTKRKNPPRLTPRERDIAQLAASGLKNKEIAQALSISPGTVKVHLMHIFEKAGVEDRLQLAAQARWLLPG